jgi:hypothetical protein
MWSDDPPLTQIALVREMLKLSLMTRVNGQLASPRTKFTLSVSDALLPTAGHMLTFAAGADRATLASMNLPESAYIVLRVEECWPKNTRCWRVDADA